MARRPEVRAALEHASADLVAALDRGEWPAAAERYVRRMCGRPTPFGLMAGISVGRLGEATRLEVEPELEPRPVSRPGDERLVPSPAAHEVEGRLHLVDRSFAVRLTPAVRAALDGDRSGPPEFLDELVRAGVLVAAEPPLEQLESVRPAPGLSLGPKAVGALRQGAEVLCSLTPDRPPAAIRLFCDRFLARYGDAEVPLLEALDDEAGLGLPEPPAELDWGDRERRMLDAVASGVDDWDIAGEDLGPGRPLPPAFAVQAALGADGLRLFGVSGPSGTRLIARHGWAEPELAERLREHVRAEAALDPEAEYREVRWLGAREAPVTARPGLREPLVPADLLVRVVEGRPVLRSRTSGRRVVPRLDTAHDFRAVRDPLYRFLGLMQDPHGEGWAGWDWGALRSAARLPRVRCGDLVLAPAQWRAPRVEDLPEWVCRVEKGRDLPVRREQAAGAPLVREMWPPPDRMATPYVHDMIVPFVEPAPVPVREPAPAPRSRIVFKPRTEWSSIKLFCGPATAERVLLETVVPFVDGRQWYFLRYDEPEWHLRVRARGLDLAPLAEDRRVWRAEIDTYVREAARYGDIEAAERCFWADSEAVVALLGSGVDRRHLAIAGVAALMEDAGAQVAFPGLGPKARRAHDREAIEAVIARDLFAARRERWRDDLANVDLASLAHMHVNRVIRVDHRREEPLVYDYLSRQTGARFSPKARTPSKKSSV